MGRKVFISFLGTSNYLQTKYIINGKKSAVVRFVQEALTDEICKDWDDNSRIIIFYTEESKKCNWLDNGQIRTNEDATIENRGLKSILEAKPYGAKVEDWQIPEGFTEEEVWNIFDTVYSKLQDGDEIYFDVTHAFRSIPLFSTILFQYTRFTKGTTLRQVCYGAFEKLGPAYKVKNIPVDEREAPVLDLSNVIQLQNLTEIANSFINYGKIGDVGNAFKLVDDNRLNQMINNFRNETTKLEDYILTNKIEKIEEGSFVQNINVTIDNIRNHFVLSKPQLDILEHLQSNISTFKVNGGISNIVAAFNWAIKYNMIIQAHVLAEETIITYTLNAIRDKTEVFETELEKRDFISSILSISSANKKKKNYKKELLRDINLTEEVFSIPLIHELRRPFGSIAQNRNELCHGKRSDLDVEKYKSQLKKKFQECMKQFDGEIENGK